MLIGGEVIGRRRQRSLQTIRQRNDRPGFHFGQGGGGSRLSRGDDRGGRDFRFGNNRYFVAGMASGCGECRTLSIFVNSPLIFPKTSLSVTLAFTARMRACTSVMI